MQNIMMIGIRIARGTRRMCTDDLMASQPNGTMMMLERKNTMKIAVTSSGLVLEDHRTGIEILQIEHADHDRGNGVAGNAEHQRRDPRAAHGGVVGGAALDDALDVTGAEFLRLLGEPLATCRS